MKSLVITILAANLLLDIFVEVLNFRRFPNSSDMSRRKNYLRENLAVGFSEQIVQLGFWLIAFETPFFDRLDQLLRTSIGANSWQGAFWLMAIGGVRSVLSLPFQAYSTFSTEARYGFNKTTLSTFIGDRLKGALLAFALGTPVLALLLQVFEKMGDHAWWLSWITMTGLSLLIGYLAPAIFLPMFNKFEPLPEGELRSSIQAYAQKEHFSMGGTFIMDGSKRSTKRNAFFTGFGRHRKLVLFDTLIAHHTPDEILSVVAHEMGHFKLGHIPKMIGISVITQGLLFWILGKFLSDPRATLGVQETLGLSQATLAGSFVLISLLYLPLSRLLSIATLGLSRKHEFEADEYSQRTLGKPEALIQALETMEVDHLSHPSPHWLKVLLEYTHPPVASRAQALRSRTQPESQGSGA